MLHIFEVISIYDILPKINSFNVVYCYFKTNALTYTPNHQWLSYTFDNLGNFCSSRSLCVNAPLCKQGYIERYIDYVNKDTHYFRRVTNFLFY